MSLIADSLDRMIVNTILVAVDGSPASVRAARAAVGFAHDHVAKVIVLAFSDGEESLGSKAPIEHDDARDSAYLIGEYALKARIPCEMDLLYSAQPAEEIIAEAERRHCDLIWLPASMGSGPDERLLHPGVATEVLARTRVPVMLFRARASA
ncbi:MAG TPA: universal stress protein [Burkholderiaceae bacterium]